MPKRILSGKVVSNKNNKTIVVEVIRKVQHNLYKKIIKKAKKYHVHTEKNNFKIGENVFFEESAPISKLKKWIVLDKNQPGKKE